MKIGVLGAGVMGTGVSQVCAQIAEQVVLIDTIPKALEKAKKEIEKGLRFQILTNKNNHQSIEIDDILKKIIFSTNYSLLAEMDYIIENISEDIDKKNNAYKIMEKICKPECIFIANTSAISITKIASVLKEPERVIGIHFMNPVPIKKAVELIKGFYTSLETEQKAKELLRLLNKEFVEVNDSPGFISNRVLMPMINEAIFLLNDKVAEVEDIDWVFKKCFGHTMGPLETADLIGLDTILNSIQVLYDSFNDSKYRPCPLLKKMVDAGLHGMKSGKGFYKYI